jgi:hypothetical protein
MQINSIGKFISEKMTSICLFLIFLSGYINNNKSCRIAFMSLVSFMLVYSLYEKFFNKPENDNNVTVKTIVPVFETVLFGVMFGMLIFKPQYFGEAMLIFVLLIVN